ncbi:MAG: M28 family metallopeptidase [Bacteroidota bacterium]
MSHPTSIHPQVSTWLEHVRVLSVDIGPRPPTRQGEREGAEYAHDQFKTLGLDPVWETFRSARSIFLPHVIGAGLMLAAFFIYPLGGRLTATIAALLSILVLVSELQELGFRDNLYRRILPKGESQNVHAVIQPAGEHKQDLVLVGHMDSQRTPFIFRSPRHVYVYDKLTTVFFITFIAQTLLYALSIFVPWSWAWYATIPTAISALLMIAMFAEADFTPFTAGANDNASAVGMVLTLAEYFKWNPLQNTRVLAVCTGCEEVGHFGMIDFYRRHRRELKHPKAVVFEMLGCAGPTWLTKEGIIVPFKADPDLVKMVEKLAADHPEWQARASHVSGGNSEMADAVRFKVPAITFFGLSPQGIPPYWHQKADTFDKMDPEVMERTWNLTTALIHRIDGAPAAGESGPLEQQPESVLA